MFEAPVSPSLMLKELIGPVTRVKKKKMENNCIPEVLWIILSTYSPLCVGVYRITSLIRSSAVLGPYSRTMPGVLWWSLEGGGCLL